MPVDPPVTDQLTRPLRDLRISVTDRCNLRCGYCMPREVFGPHAVFLPRGELLSFEEIALVTTAAARLGVRKIRVTGGEPLLRRDLPELVAMLAAVPGIDEVALTTNGVLLAELAAPLAAAGLGRVTVSLDALDPDVFRAASDSGVAVERVLEGIEAAQLAGLRPLKLNTVVRRGVNENQILALADHARRTGATIRFIEYMDVGTTNGWRPDEVVPAAEIVARIHEAFPAEPADAPRGSEPAERYRYLDGAGEFGVIASVTRPFCGDCVRARLSPVGELFTCLFAGSGTDLRSVLRGHTATSDALAAAIADTWRRRSDRYSELRGASPAPARRVEMSYIGG